MVTDRLEGSSSSGGMEIPCICTLTFTATEQSSIDKIRTLIKHIDEVTSRLASKVQQANEEHNEHKTDQESEDCSPLAKVMKLADNSEKN